MPRLRNVRRETTTESGGHSFYALRCIEHRHWNTLLGLDIRHLTCERHIYVVGEF